MRVVLSPSKAEAVDTVIMMVMDKIKGHPASVIGLATGKTMEPVYQGWCEAAEKTGLDLSKSFYFMLDEYAGLASDHPASFKTYIRRRLLAPLKIREDQIAFPPVEGSDWKANAESYEKLIRESGGVDLQILGVGTNGHIGFNEPGSEKTSRTRLVSLTDETKEANKEYFPDGKIPTDALSMGIATILDAKSIVLLATGKSKADAMKYLMNHHDDPACPVTYLKAHPDFVLVLDPDAASRINLKI